MGRCPRRCHPNHHQPHHLTVFVPRSQRRSRRTSATESLQLLSTELLPTFPQAEATFPAQTQRQGQASELPFLPQRNAHQAASLGFSPDSTCDVGDVGFISSSQTQGDGGRAGRGGGEDKIPGTAGEIVIFASKSKVKRTHPLPALCSTSGDREPLDFRNTWNAWPSACLNGTSRTIL